MPGIFRSLRASLATVFRAPPMFVNGTKNVQIDQGLRIAAIAFETQVAMLITDSGQNILGVNRAFSELSGFTADNLLGKKPQMLHCDLHNHTAHSEIWDRINCDGFWRGEIIMECKDGSVHPVWSSITAVKAEDGKVSNYVLACSNIAQRKAVDEDIKQMAFYDTLTKLGNRRLLLKHLKLAIDQVNQTLGRGALFFINLDNF